MKSDRRQDLKQRIKTLPGLSTEDRQALLGLLAERKRYGLVWEDKPEAAHELLREKIPVFVEDDSRRIRASEDDAPHHVLIEGDNLHALAALQYTHAGKVDVIYIDPPYNTGNKDFRYNDDYVDKEDAWRHSMWLSFVSKRLRLAKALLSRRGMIYISIDDNELPQLRLLCSEVFGEKQFIGQVVWQKKFAPQNDAKHIDADTEYVVVVANDVDQLKLNLMPRTDDMDSRYKNPDNDPRGPWTSGDPLRREYRDYAYYPIKLPSGREVFPPPGTSWRFNREEIPRLVSENRIWFGKDGNGVPRLKRFLSDVKDGVVPQTLWLHEGVGHTQEAKKEIIRILGDSKFDTPKPTRLLSRILRIGSTCESIILDFFAGSGTTLHATMALNAEDGGKRQCILVTNNENGICEEVCFERNKRVIQGYTTPKGEAVPGLTANHLHYLKTEFVDREPNLRNRRKLMKLAVDLLRLKEDAWERCTGPDTKDVRTFEGGDAVVVVVLDSDAIPDAVEWIAGQERRCKVFVFSPGAYPWTEEFEEVQDKVDLCALPEALYRVFETVLPSTSLVTEVEE